MAITFTDGGAWVTFDSTLELALWAFVVPSVVGACMGCLVTVYYPSLAHRLFIFIHAVAVAAAGRLIRSLLLAPARAALAWGVVAVA